MPQPFKARVFADLNCPFCFVLHERLYELSMLEVVDWCTIEHAPNINEEADKQQGLAQLEEEYNLVIQRAPEVDIINPHFVPCTAIANLFLFVVRQLFPEELIEFRLSLYRALWQEGRDISNIDVLTDILTNMGIPALQLDVDVTPLELWQKEWHGGDFDQRIPSMLRFDNELMLGLQNKTSLANFLNGRAFEATKGQNSCKLVTSFKVVILSDNDSLNDVIFDDAFQMSHYLSGNDVTQAIDIATPDIVVLDEAHDDSLKLCGSIQSLNEKNEFIPVVFVSFNDNRSNEAQALNAGASDFVCLPEQTFSIEARFKTHIRTKQKLEILVEHAVKDGLTGVNNRRHFEFYLEKKWRHACRYQHPIGLLMIDIDHFKDYNDLYGHPAGDDTLKNIAYTIATNLFRVEDFVGRYGGEEFAVILPDISKKDLIHVANRIRQAVAELNISHDTSKVTNVVTVSVGASITFAHADNSKDDLVAVADKALYEAKLNGRNQVQCLELRQPKYK